MDYSNAAAAAVLQSIGTPETETESSAVAALESALQQNRPPAMHGLNTGLTVTNNKRNGTEVRVWIAVWRAANVTSLHSNGTETAHLLTGDSPVSGGCHHQYSKLRARALFSAQS